MRDAALALALLTLGMLGAVLGNMNEVILVLSAIAIVVGGALWWRYLIKWIAKQFRGQKGAV